VAIEGDGVFDTLKVITQRMMGKVQGEI